VRLALDDFGTGYSSLSHLAHLPVDNLKIDKSFTDDVPFGPNRTLMAGVLALAGQVGMTPVVEGIEAQEQVRELLAMGARYGQGFFFSRPISSEAFVEQLRLQSLERSLTA
jgi:EAL domain-containing protein (putative c-di-GMP-specific phosphodiesterase class I)